MSSPTYHVLAQASGSAALTTYVVLYTADVPTIIGELRIVNKNAAAKKIRVAVSNATAPAAADFLVYDYPVPPSGAQPAGDLTGFVLDTTVKYLIISSESTDVNFVLVGSKVPS